MARINLAQSKPTRSSKSSGLVSREGSSTPLRRLSSPSNPPSSKNAFRSDHLSTGMRVSSGKRTAAAAELDSDSNGGPKHRKRRQASTMHEDDDSFEPSQSIPSQLPPRRQPQRSKSPKKVDTEDERRAVSDTDSDEASPTATSEVKANQNSPSKRVRGGQASRIARNSSPFIDKAAYRSESENVGDDTSSSSPEPSLPQKVGPPGAGTKRLAPKVGPPKGKKPISASSVAPSHAKLHSTVSIPRRRTYASKSVAQVGSQHELGENREPRNHVVSSTISPGRPEGGSNPGSSPLLPRPSHSTSAISEIDPVEPGMLFVFGTLVGPKLNDPHVIGI